MKKLKKSFLVTRVEEIATIPPTWQLNNENILNNSYFFLDARLCQLSSIKHQLSCLVASVKNVAGLSPSKSIQKHQEAELPGPDYILSADFSFNDLSALTFSDLASFVELRRLIASFNTIQNFSGILSCPYLTYLCLSYNNIKKLPLAELKECSYLQHMIPPSRDNHREASYQKTQKRSLDGIELFLNRCYNSLRHATKNSLTNLCLLQDFRSNLIDDISDLCFLPNLRYFNLSFNSLKSLDGLQALPALVALDVKHNHIENVAGVSACFSLEQIDLSENNLRSVSHVVDALSHLKSLQQLNVNKHFEDLKKLLPVSTTVKILDGKVIAGVKGIIPALESVFSSTEDEFKSALKSEAQEMMEEEAASLETYRTQQLHFMHSKIRCFNAEMEDKKQRNEEKFLFWSSYVDGLSLPEATALSRRCLNSQSSQGRESEEVLPSKNVVKNRSKTFDTKTLLAEVNRALTHAAD